MQVEDHPISCTLLKASKLKASKLKASNREKTLSTFSVR